MVLLQVSVAKATLELAGHGQSVSHSLLGCHISSDALVFICYKLSPWINMKTQKNQSFTTAGHSGLVRS